MSLIIICRLVFLSFSARQLVRLGPFEYHSALYNERLNYCYKTKFVTCQEVRAFINECRCLYRAIFTF
jgi:hypothetical protein